MKHGNGIEKYVSAKQKQLILSGQTPPWILRHVRKNYLVSSFLAAPMWMTSSMLRPLREQANELTQRTGVLHVLDHAIPVSHPYVCGLTVPWNMEVVPKHVNAAKSNNWHPDQQRIEFHPQMTLF